MIRVFMDLWIKITAILSEHVIKTSGGGCPSLNSTVQYLYSCSEFIFIYIQVPEIGKITQPYNPRIVCILGASAYSLVLLVGWNKTHNFNYCILDQ